MSSIYGRNLIIDSNIIIYYFTGTAVPDSTLTRVIEENYLNISIMSEIEVLGFDLSKEDHGWLIKFFDDMNTYPISSDIKRKAVFLKRFYRLKTVDSIIAATARSLDYPLISADKVFSKVKEINFVLYQVKLI